jgi:hypothetical protein
MAKENDIEFAIIEKYVKDNADTEQVKSFIASVASKPQVNKEVVNAFLETSEGQELLQPVLQSHGDKRVTEAIKTREKSEEARVEAEVKKKLAIELLKLNPKEEPWQQEIRDLKAQAEEEKQARLKENLKRQIIEAATKMKVDPWFIDDYQFQSLELAELYMKRIAERDKKLEEKIRNELLAQYSIKPGAGQDSGKGKKLDLTKLSAKEILKMEEEGKLDEAMGM